MVVVLDHLLYHLYQLDRDSHCLGLDRVVNVVGRVGSSQRLLGLLLVMQSMLGQLKVRKNPLSMFRLYR